MSDIKNESRRLLTSFKRIDEVYYRIGKASDVKETLLFLLYSLSDGVPKTQKQICEELLLPKTTVSTVIKECIQSGFVRFQPGEDKREKILILTDNGRKYAEQVVEPVKRIEELALNKTLKQCSPEFIDAIEVYVKSLEEASATYPSEKE